MFFLLTLLKIIKKYLTNDFIFSYTLRPKYANNIVVYNCNVTNIINYSEFAIIIQGQLDDFIFTYETISLYRKFYPGINICLSTWVGQLSPAQIKKLHDLGIDLIESEPPINPGFKNINCQIKSTLMGINSYKEKNIKFILKTRSDQRFYNIMTISYLLNIYKFFDPCKIKIIACSLNTFKQRLYSISDMFLFGDIDSMLNFWQVDFDSRPISFINNQLSTIKNNYDYSKINVCEQYLVTNYLKSKNEEVIWDEAHSTRLICKYFTIIDQSSIDLVWQKYSLREYLWRNYDGNSLSELSFNDWLLNYVQIKNQENLSKATLDS